MPKRRLGHRRNGGGQISKCGQANIFGENRTGNVTGIGGIKITVRVQAGRARKGITKGVIGLRRTDQWTGRQIERSCSAMNTFFIRIFTCSRWRLPSLVTPPLSA
jgi:hypothetical protein